MNSVVNTIVQTSAGICRLSAPMTAEDRFYEHLDLTLQPAVKTTRVRLDARFLAACEPDSVRVCSVTGSWPQHYGVRIKGEEIEIERDGYLLPESQVHVMLTGIRAGFSGRRFPEATAEEMRRNHAQCHTLNGYRAASVLTTETAYPGLE